MGPEQAQAFKRYGVAPNRCLIGHCCANSDLRYQKAILDEGVYVGFDRFGNSWHGDDYFRMATLAALIHMGFSNLPVHRHGLRRIFTQGLTRKP